MGSPGADALFRRPRAAARYGSALAAGRNRTPPLWSAPTVLENGSPSRHRERIVGPCLPFRCGLHLSRRSSSLCSLAVGASMGRAQTDSSLGVRKGTHPAPISSLLSVKRRHRAPQEMHRIATSSAFGRSTPRPQAGVCGPQSTGLRAASMTSHLASTGTIRAPAREDADPES